MPENEAESLPTIHQREIAGALFDRRDNGSLVIITSGAYDPVFNTEQIGEIREFLADSDNWLAARAQAHKAGEAQVARAAARAEAAAAGESVKPRRVRPSRSKKAKAAEAGAGAGTGA
jgi:hypothetical protein